jgi:hypothetical protein
VTYIGNSKEEDTGYVEPEPLNLVALKAATNNFSEENKLGEGGFGEVFKVYFHTFSHEELLRTVKWQCGANRVSG